MKIGIIIGSVREGRNAPKVAQWVQEAASRREGVDYELLDLKEFNLPFMTAAKPPMMADRTYDDPAVQAWSAAIDPCDGFLFVTPEYNHGVPGAFKNAVDLLGPEWLGKSVGFISFGADGGVRAVEQWRQILVNFSMHTVRAQVSLNVFTEFADGSLQVLERRNDELDVVFRQLEAAVARSQA